MIKISLTLKNSQVTDNFQWRCTIRGEEMLMPLQRVLFFYQGDDLDGASKTFAWDEVTSATIEREPILNPDGTVSHY